MAHETPAALDALALLVGTLGVLIALYLQTIMQRRCPAQYVFGFFAAGAVMILMHLTPIPTVPRTTAVYARLAAVLIVFAGEVWGFWYVYHHATIQTPLEAFAAIMDGDPDGDDEDETAPVR